MLPSGGRKVGSFNSSCPGLPHILQTFDALLPVLLARLTIQLWFKGWSDKINAYLARSPLYLLMHLPDPLDAWTGVNCHILHIKNCLITKEEQPSWPKQRMQRFFWVFKPACDNFVYKISVHYHRAASTYQPNHILPANNIKSPTLQT
jgi:hypothetical protein